MHNWVLSGYSGFLPQSKNMHVRLIDYSKLTIGVSECEHAWLFFSVMDWRTVQGVSCLSPNGSWDRLQPPVNPE